MMNCLEFRRLKLSEPKRLSEEALAHVSECPGCLAFARGVDESEAALERALAVPVPEGLADRILLARGGRRRANRWAYALAASLVLAVAAGVFVATREPDSANQARLAIEHVIEEPQSLTTFHDADPERLAAIVRDFGGNMREPIGRVRYIKLCPVEQGTGWHIVFETPQGLATLILVPDRPIAAAATASLARFTARVEPVRGGYYALVTDSAGSTSAVNELLKQRIDWRT
jgi:hypothetical protein